MKACMAGMMEDSPGCFLFVSDLKALLDFSPVALIFWEERMEGGSS